MIRNQRSSLTDANLAVRRLIYVLFMIRSTFRYAFATRRWSVIAVIVLGLILLVLSFTVQTVTPVLLYPLA